MTQTILTLAAIVTCTYIAYGIGYRRGLGQSYMDVSRAARMWMQESAELLKKKWSDCL
jgi:hypothetical protein